MGNFSPDPSNLRYILGHGSAIFYLLFYFLFALRYKGLVYLQKKVRSKGESWTLHYPCWDWHHHGNLLRDQVKLHFLIFLSGFCKQAWKTFIEHFYWLCFYLCKVLSKCNLNGGLPTFNECFLAITWQKNRNILMTTWPGHAFQLVSCRSRNAKFFKR